jgi:hypothetical protein
MLMASIVSAGLTAVSGTTKESAYIAIREQTARTIFRGVIFLFVPFALTNRTGTIPSNNPAKKAMVGIEKRSSRKTIAELNNTAPAATPNRNIAMYLVFLR